MPQVEATHQRRFGWAGRNSRTQSAPSHSRTSRTRGSVRSSAAASASCAASRRAGVPVRCGVAARPVSGVQASSRWAGAPAEASFSVRRAPAGGRSPRRAAQSAAPAASRTAASRTACTAATSAGPTFATGPRRSSCAVSQAVSPSGPAIRSPAPVGRVLSRSRARGSPVRGNGGVDVMSLMLREALDPLEALG
ncbi:hypothetical protein VR46_32195 [Streptomyces sp. NRRL S-444]|nr:hypothetical protein VR46_32195 [Streptomyces sp. NRRL S-444]